MVRQDNALATGPSRPRKVQPPRPPNAWILYRSFKFASIREKNERISQAAVSKMISDMWKSESEEVKRHFERMADDKKAEHQQMYPDYRYAPQKKEEKERAKKERKQGRLGKKPKAHDATLADADARVDVNVDANLNATMMAPPPMAYIPHHYPYLAPGYQPNAILPHPYATYYLPEAFYGPNGPSPPISAAPSPVSCDPSESPKGKPYPDSSVDSSSSEPSAQPSPSSESQASSSQLPPNQPFYSPLPSSHQPSPHLYATQPLPTLLFQLAAPGEVLPTENTNISSAPAWNDISTELSGLESPNSAEVVNFDVPIDHPQNFTQFPQSLPDNSSLESLQGMFAGTSDNGLFNLSNVETTDLVARPEGNFELGMGPPAPVVDYNQQLFIDFDFAQFQQQMSSLESDPSPAAVAPPPVQDDIQALFQTSGNPEIQAHTAARQRQPSLLTQDMMSFFNFDAAGSSTEDTSSAEPSPSLPTAAAPQQVRPQSTQDVATMPIFTQMTNVPTATFGTPYVPPAGAMYSSTRRVAGSWKQSFVNPFLQMEDPVQSWSFSAN